MKDLLCKPVLKITGKHLLTMFEKRREILYEEQNINLENDRENS